MKHKTIKACDAASTKIGLNLICLRHLAGFFYRLKINSFGFGWRSKQKVLGMNEWRERNKMDKIIKWTIVQQISSKKMTKKNDIFEWEIRMACLCYDGNVCDSMDTTENCTSLWFCFGPITTNTRLTKDTKFFLPNFPISESISGKSVKANMIASCKVSC